MKLNNEKGYTLITVILAVLILTILGGAYILAMNFEVRQSYNHEFRVQAYYYGRSGVEATSSWLLENQDDFLRFNSEGFLVPGDKLNGETGEFKIFFNGNLNEGLKEGQDQKDISSKIIFEIKDKPGKDFEIVGKITIEAVGNYRGENETVILKMDTFSGSFFDNAVFTYSDLYADQSPKDEVRVYGDAESKGEIISNPGQITGTQTPYSERWFPDPVFPENLHPQPDISLQPQNVVTVDPKDTDKVDSDKVPHYTSISIANNSELIFLADGDGPTKIVVDEIAGTGGGGGFGTLNTECDNDNCNCEEENQDCDGIVYLFVNNSAEIKTPEGGNPVPIVLFLAEGATLNLIAGSEFNGLIYGPKATVYMQGNVTVNGSMVVQDLRRSEQQSSFIGVVDNREVNIKVDEEYFSQLEKLRRGIWR